MTLLDEALRRRMQRERVAESKDCAGCSRRSLGTNNLSASIFQTRLSEQKREARSEEPEEEEEDEEQEQEEEEET